MPEQQQAAAPPQPVRRHPPLGGALLRRALKAIYEPHPAPTVFPRGPEGKTRLHRLAGEMASGGGALTYLEFGVHKGASFRGMLQRITHPDARFYGFDSFAGLPEDWAGKPAGFFSTDGALPRLTDRRASFVKGWFQDTLPSFLAAHPITGPVLVHFDADLYSSTLFVLSRLWGHVPEYYFLFDEFVPDEVVALHDFARAYPIRLDFIAYAGEGGRPGKVFGKLTNTKFQLNPESNIA